MLGISFYFDWEVKLIETLQAHFNSFGVLLSRVFSMLGQEYILTFFILLCYFCIDKKVGKRLCINLMAVLIWVPMLKNLVFRRRPYFDHEGIDILLPVDFSADKYDIAAQGFSFPSAHTACSTAAYPMLAKSTKKKGLFVLSIILITLIGFSRVCVGAHYPTDVIAGWIIGGISAIFIPYLYGKFKNENLINLIILATGIPGLFYCKTDEFFTAFGLFLGVAFGFIVEEKYVNFELPKTFLQGLLRIVFAALVFLGIAQGIKLILGTSTAVRVIRYAIASFVAVGIYPMVFKKIEKEK